MNNTPANNKIEVKGNSLFVIAPAPHSGRWYERANR